MTHVLTLMAAIPRTHCRSSGLCRSQAHAAHTGHTEAGHRGQATTKQDFRPDVKTEWENNSLEAHDLVSGNHGEGEREKEG